MHENDMNKLIYSPQNIHLINPNILYDAEKYCDGYKDFINTVKTERECVEYLEEIALSNGFKRFDKLNKIKSGDKIYSINRNKNIIFAIIGNQSIDKGVNMVAAHMDSPRLDLKPRPLYENSRIAYLKTHYYGGIKKYQWTAVPLSLHGVVYNRKGEKIKICIGEEENEPGFFISDLMPHIAKDQFDKKLADAIDGEGLNLIAGSLPIDEISESTKLNILSILEQKYDISEYEFLTAEICAVPSQKAKDIGFDRSLIAGYGQDDKACVYAAATALFELAQCEKTCVVFFSDKEEIGSEGVTGIKGHSFWHFIMKLCELTENDYKECFSNSCCLPLDVVGAYDPGYAEAYEISNSVQINNGIVVMKYAGARGKFGASDASAELLYKVTSLFNQKEVIWQIGEMGKVDQGGGNTISKEIAIHNIDVLDIGIPLLSIHSPVELVSKLDLYMLNKAVTVFLKNSLV